MFLKFARKAYSYCLRNSCVCMTAILGPQRPMVTEVSLLLYVCCSRFTIVFQAVRRCESTSMFANGIVWHYMRRLPSGLWVPVTVRAIRARRTTLLSGMRRMCPRYRNLRCRIARIRSNTGAVAVRRYSWPVMTCRHRLLKPLILHITAAVNVHASDECVKVEHTANWYVLSFSARDSRWSAQMFDNEPNVVCAIGMR